jgi:hypothetical protein
MVEQFPSEQEIAPAAAAVELARVDNWPILSSCISYRRHYFRSAGDFGISPLFQ